MHLTDEETEAQKVSLKVTKLSSNKARIHTWIAMPCTSQTLNHYGG